MDEIIDYRKIFIDYLRAIMNEDEIKLIDRIDILEDLRFNNECYDKNTT